MIKKKRIMLSIIISSIFLITPSQLVHAETIRYTVRGDGGLYTYNYEELWKRYEAYSITYKRNMLNSEIESLKGSIAETSYTTISGQYIENIYVLESLKTEKELLENKKQLLLEGIEASRLDGLDEENFDGEFSDNEEGTVSNRNDLINTIDKEISDINMKIIQYSNSAVSLEANTADVQLQKDLALFYKTNQELIKKNAENQLNFNFLKSCFQMILEQEEVEYYKEYKEYLSVLHTAEEIKYNYGYAKKNDLERTKMEQLKNNNTLALKKNNVKKTLNTILNNTKIQENSNLILTFNLVKKKYDKDKKTAEFLANNSEYLLLKNTESSYQIYLKSFGTANIDIYRQVELQIEDYRLQQKELKYNIESYVKEAVSQYDIAFGEMEAAKAQLEVSEQECVIAKALLDHKKGTKLNVNKAYVEKSSSRIEYYKSIYNILVWESILDNCIYDSVL